MSDPLWVVEEADALEIKLRSTSGKWTARVAMDGCVELQSEEPVRPIHICDTWQMIRLLTEIREIARERFPDNEWSHNFWHGERR